MNSNLFFDFTLDKAAKTVVIIREFLAPQALVWDAFTKAELLDKWVAPKPWTSQTKYMNFEVGGKRFYAMVSPEGVARWSMQTYTSITPTTNFKYHNAFSDAEENLELPGSEWDVSFIGRFGRTSVNINIYNESLSRLEKMMEMGFKEGFSMSIENLDNLLALIQSK